MEKIIKKSLAFLVAGVAPFILLEIVLRIIGYVPSDAWYFEGFHRETPIFELQGNSYTLAPGEEQTFHSQSFSVDRPPGALRVFSIGDSVVWGFAGNENVKPLKAYSEILQEQLREQTKNPGQRVVNCGARTYASRRVLGVLENVLHNAPDIMLASFGSSEFLELTVYASYLERERRSPYWLWRLRMMQWFEELVRKMIAEKGEGLTAPELRARDTRLSASFIDNRYVLNNEQEQLRVLEGTRKHVEKMIAECRKKNTPLVLMTVPSNLKWPPFASRLTNPAARKDLDELIVHCGELLGNKRAHEVIALLEPALTKYPEVASLHFTMAKALEVAGEIEKAKAEYIAAKETDAFPLRALGRFNEMIRELASSERGVHLVDMERMMEHLVSDGIPDDRLFLDHCHPKQEIHARMATEILRVIEKEGLLEKSFRK